MHWRKQLVASISGGKAAAAPSFQLTCTTTGAQTLTLQGLTVATGKTVTVDWGDNSSDTYTAGAGTRTHNYTGAGAYTVKMFTPENITLLDLRDAKLSGTISASNPLPSGLTSLRLESLSGLTYNANTNPLPAGLTSLNLYSLSGLTWEIKAGAAWPTGAAECIVTSSPNVTVSAWTDNAIQSIRLENAYNQAAVDAVVNAIWANKANFTYATPSLDILGGSNAAPSGTYQAANPPATGKEKIFDLVNGNFTPAGPEWTVQYQA